MGREKSNIQDIESRAIELVNRVIKAATFEGTSPHNVGIETPIGFPRRRVAVSPEGMGAPAEIFIHDRAAARLGGIADIVQGEGIRIRILSGHVGAVRDLPGKRKLGPYRSRNRHGARDTRGVLDRPDPVEIVRLCESLRRGKPTLEYCDSAGCIVIVLSSCLRCASSVSFVSMRLEA